MGNDKGLITIPTDFDFIERTKQIIEEWGADAIRNCDGTVLTDEEKNLDIKVYSTYFVTRGDNVWAKANEDEWQHFLVMTDFITATDAALSIELLKGYFSQQIKIDDRLESFKYWEVIDRTSGRLLPDGEWSYNTNDKRVTVFNAEFMHEYTVSFFATTIWDSTQMYNYITNNWTKEKELSYDPRYPKTREYIKRHMREWLTSNDKVDVVRFTTFFYHFTLLFNDKKKEKYVDWFGYTMSASPKAFDDFEAEYGYKLRAEDLIDRGYYGNPFTVPKKPFLDYMDFTQKFVCENVKDLISITHEFGKEAMMFLGDTWIGVEPYGKYFKSLNLDAIVGSIGGGVTVRMLTDSEGAKYTEGRFLPYFFPDTFCEGGKPEEELNKNWLSARRAIMRKPLDRIGYGGYLKLADKFPSFMNRVAEICDEFREIYHNIKNVKPYSGVKVAMLNSWGKLRSWQSHMVAHELWYKQIYSYQGILESLSGLAADVSFLSFADVRAGGIPKDVDVIINAGDAGTAYSGAEEWDERVIAAVKGWIYSGGGFVGVGEPSAILKNGKYFQLSSCLGVERELGLTLSHDKYNWNAVKEHFITADNDGLFDLGELISNVYALDGADVLYQQNKNVMLAANKFGMGRCFYATGLPFTINNARLLYRALFYVAGKEQNMLKWYSANKLTECNYYEGINAVAILNNSQDAQETEFYDGSGKSEKIRLNPMEIKWIKY